MGHCLPCIEQFQFVNLIVRVMTRKITVIAVPATDEDNAAIAA